MKNNLNQKFWTDEDKLDSQVRKNLLQIAKDFIAFTKVKNLKLHDVILIGSIANYNWNNKSDVDLHILFDLKNFEKQKKFILEFLQSKKAIWNLNHDIILFGHTVEIYPDDKDSEFHSMGVYSLIKNDWISKPEKIQLTDKNVDKKLIMKKYQSKVDTILRLEENSKNKKIDKDLLIKNIERFLIKLKDERQEGLESDGELSVENLVFKMLRNNGYIEKIKELKNTVYDEKISIVKEQPLPTGKPFQYYLSNANDSLRYSVDTMELVNKISELMKKAGLETTVLSASSDTTDINSVPLPTIQFLKKDYKKFDKLIKKYLKKIHQSDK